MNTRTSGDASRIGHLACVVYEISIITAEGRRRVWSARRFLCQLRCDKLEQKDLLDGTRKEASAEQIVNFLRQVEVGTANGKSMAQACEEAEIGDDRPPQTSTLSSPSGLIESVTIRGLEVIAI
jgi:hypothetical protein